MKNFNIKTQEELLEQIIEKARKGGWLYFVSALEELGCKRLSSIHELCSIIFFSHDFCRAYFGEEKSVEIVSQTENDRGHNLESDRDYDTVKIWHCSNCDFVIKKDDYWSWEDLPICSYKKIVNKGWQYHIQQLALTPESERINYLHKFI